MKAVARVLASALLALAGATNVSSAHAVRVKPAAAPGQSTPTQLTPSQALPMESQRAQTAAERVLVARYLGALQQRNYAAAYTLLNTAAQRYYRDARNFHSVFAADAYRIERFSFVGVRTSAHDGSVYFMRETARYRDHAHDADLVVTATVPLGVVNDHGRPRIKDPGHPWRAFAADATTSAAGLRVTVKKLAFFERRIEVIVTFANLGDAFITLLPYGKSLLRDEAGRPFRIIETRNWALTDRTLFEGLQLAPNAQYTGMLAFVSGPLDNVSRRYSLTLAPLLVHGAELPFSIDVNEIAAQPLAAGP